MPGGMDDFLLNFADPVRMRVIVPDSELDPERNFGIS